MEDQKVLKAFVGDSIRDSIQEMKDSISKDLAECRSMLLEVLGEKNTTSFEPKNIVMNVKLGQFRGENPDAWIVQAEHYFNCYKIEEDQKLNVASFYFDGEALEWYGWLFRNNQLAGWDHFVDKLMIRFRSRTRDTHRGFLSIPTKTNRTVEYYQEAIPSWGNITNSSSPQSYQYDIFIGNYEVGHVFDKMPEKCNDVDFSDSTSVGNNRNTFEEMDNRSSLMISSVLSVYDQMVTDPYMSNNTTKDEAISFPNKVLSQSPQYGHDHLSRGGGQHVRTLSYETHPPQEPIILSLSAFSVHNDHSMNTFVNDAKLVKAITVAKSWKVVVAGREYNECELIDHLGLLVMDEVTIKHFRISTTRMFDNSLRWFCVIGCGHKVARPLIGDPNFSWTVIFKEYQMAGVAKRTNTLVSVTAENYKFTCLMSLDRPEVVPTDCPIDFYIQTTSLVGRRIRYCVFSLTDEVGLHLNFVLDDISVTVHGVMKHLNQLNQGLPLVPVKFCTDAPFQALSYKHQSGEVCCRDNCHFRGGKVLVKVGQDVQDAMEVMPISLILSKDNIKLHFASNHLDLFLWPNLLLDVGVLFHFTLVTLQCVEIVTRQII
ncbi:hypothetical protein KY285_027628 [Solanum tuberosum]|nr:hypothetical protein KY285_027628 [Solanum tuberosum]